MIRQILIPFNEASLVGVLHTHTHTKKIVCLFMHGYGSFKEESGYLYSIIARRLEGVDCVLFDYYGCGDSPGDIREVTIETMTHNARVMIEYVRSFFPTYRLILIAKGISIPIALQLSKENSLNELICIGDLDNLSFPKHTLTNELLWEWEKNGEMNLRYMLNQIGTEERLQVSKWLDTLGAWDVNLLSEYINYKVISTLENITPHISIPYPQRALWFVSNNKWIKEDICTKWVVLNRGNEKQPFRCPEIIEKMALEILNWLGKQTEEIKYYEVDRTGI